MDRQLTRVEFDYWSALWHAEGVHISPCSSGLKMVAAQSVRDADFIRPMPNAVANLYDVEQERESETLRQETAQDARAPFWIALPVQFLCCLLWLMFIVTSCVGFVCLGALYIVLGAVCAISRGLRWVFHG